MIESYARFERFLAEISFICPECGEKNIRNYSPDGVYSLLECLERDKCDKCGVGIEIYESNDPVGEIVRCRDCKWLDHRNLYLCMLPDGDGGYACWLVKPDGFCAWASKRKGAES